MIIAILLEAYELLFYQRVKLCYYKIKYLDIDVRSIFLNQNFFVGPIVLRYIFFGINLFFTVRVLSEFGWNFLAILLAVFATRDFVQAVRLTSVYLKIKNHNGKN